MMFPALSGSMIHFPEMSMYPHALSSRTAAVSSENGRAEDRQARRSADVDQVIGFFHC
jgi:hypothetical protein